MVKRDIFSRLKKVFSGDSIVRNVGGKQIKIADINKIQTTGKYETNSLVDRFSRLYIYNNKNIFNPNLNYQTLRIQLYSDYEAMDTDPLLASTLDILADETTVKNDRGRVLSIKSSDENIQRILDNLFYDVLNIEFNLWSWSRNLCKYGDFFLKLEIAEEFGVYNVLPYTVYHMVRKEGEDHRDPTKTTFRLDPEGLASSQDPNYLPNDSKSVIDFENYEVAHFRLLSDTNYLPYGRSYLEPARKIYKQLTMMEDAMLIHRIMRAPEKRVFYINVGHIPPNEVEQFMQKTVDNIKKTPYVDPDTGQYNLRFNMQNMMEDFYMPVRGGDTSTKIDTTKGLDYDGTNDIEYLRDKMFAALKVPKAYFGYEGELSGKATLAAEDIRFARTVERIQRILESELTKIALVHLYVQGIRGEGLTNFELKLSNPSIIFEQERVALLKEKMDLANDMKDSGLFPTDYIYEEIFDLSEDRYEELRGMVIQDSHRLFRKEQIENEGNDPVKSGKSFGTPHDLATLYGRREGVGKEGPQMGEVPPGYEDHPNPPKKRSKRGQPGPEGGRPKTNMSAYGTNDASMGRDPLGKHGMEGGFESDNQNVKEDVTVKNYPKTKQVMNKTGILKQLDKEGYSNNKQISGSKEDPKLLNEDHLKEY